jgi:hypothetical protein
MFEEMALQWAARERRVPTLDEAADLIWPERTDTMSIGAVRVSAQQFCVTVWSLLDADRMWEKK